MKSLILALVLISISTWSDAYNYQRSSYTSSSTQQCCQLSPWAHQHMDVVRSLADQLRNAYNSRSRGQTARYTNQAWSEKFANSIGKSNAEVNAISQQLADQIVADMHAGRISYGQVAQPNYFEAKAAAALEKLDDDAEYVDNQQQQVELYEPVVPHIVRPGGSVDLSNFDDVKHYNYPTEVKVVNGQTVITNKNSTTATRHVGMGTSPYVTTVRVNRTTTHTTVPVYVSQGSTIGHPFFNHHDHSIYSHLNKQEVGVPNYSPQVTVDDSFDVGMNQMNTQYTPPIVIPVEGSDQFDSFGIGNQYGGIRPGHTVTVRKYNRTIITGPDGRPIVSGSESKSVWDNGQLVYNHIAPFGNVSWTKDDLWKREERERLFWVFQGGAITLQDLEEWQRNQEERLLALAYRSNKTIEEVEEWQRQELDRYKVLVNQYNTASSDLTDWQRRERGRIDWLIHQNGITREELERWQKENERKLAILAREYQISFEELKEYHRQELNRLYVIFNQQNSQINSSNLNNLHVFQKQESDRLNSILSQHNSTVDQLQEQIRRDQDRYKDLAKQYRINVEDMEKFFKGELNRLTNVINQQQEEMKRITDWQRSERTRLEDIVRHHNFTVEELEQKMKLDRNYLTQLAQKYHISMEELEKWQRSEIDRIHETGKVNLQKELEEWQQQERARMLDIIKKNDLTIEEYESKIGNDRSRLQQLASTYQVQVEEIERWLKEEAQRLKTEGVFSEVQKNLTIWQQQERDRLQAIVQNNEVTIEELQNKISKDQNRLFSLANTYQVRVEEIEEWLKKELLRLQSQGMVKKDDLQDWQKAEREKILLLLQENKVTVEDYEKKLLSDKSHLQQLAAQYHVELKDIETWLRKESDRLKNLGLIEEEKLTEWQKIERNRILALIQKNELSIEDVQKKIKADQVHLYSLAHRYSVRVEEIEEWLKKEVLRLQNEANIESANLKDWQKVERDRIMMLVKQNDLTIDEFIQKIKTDRAYLHQLAMQYHVKIEEIEEWAKSEGTRLESLGLIKPNAALTDWQQVERDRLLMLVKQNDLTIDEFIQKIKTDRAFTHHLAMQYQVQVEEIEEWVKTEGTRLQSLGLVKPSEALTDWQQVERDRFLMFVKQNDLTIDEFIQKIKLDRPFTSHLAMQYQVQMEEIEEWVKKEGTRLQSLGLVKPSSALTDWQQVERDRLMMLVKQNDLTIDEFYQKIKTDRAYLQHLAMQYQVQIEEIEEWVKREGTRLQSLGLVKPSAALADWQQVERDRLMMFVKQNDLTIDEFIQKMKTDRAYLQHMAMQYHIQVEEIEDWVKREGARLQSLGFVKPNAALTDWQELERDHVLQVVQGQDQLSLDQLEERLRNDRAHLMSVAQEYQVQVQEIEEWIRKELQRLQNQGVVQIENLKQWQQTERDHLNALIAQQQNGFSLDEFERQLKADRQRLQILAAQNNVQVKEIEEWIHNELERVKARGQEKIVNLTEWQKIERDRLLTLAQQHSDLSAAELEKELQMDRERLQKLAWQYHIEVEEVEEFIRKEVQRLRDQGKSQLESLTTWQLGERDRLRELIQHQSQLSVEQIEKQLKADRNRLQQLAYQYHIQVEEVEEWIRKEADRLRNQGELHIGNITEWQMTERKNIQQLIQHNSDLTVEELENQLKADQYRLQNLARQYHVSVEEVEIWIKKELQRLRDEGKLEIENLTAWQKAERERLLQLAKQQSQLSLIEFEEKLTTDRRRLEQLANQYHISVLEIEEWIKKEAERLENQGVIGDLQDWQKLERSRIHDLLKQNNVTIEEFREELRKDHNRLQQLAQQYHITVEEVEEWILNEGSRQIKPEALTDWQSYERARLHSFNQAQPLTLEAIETNLRNERNRLYQIAQRYHVTIEEIEEYIRKEGQRLIKPAPLTVWQEEERQRLFQQIGQPQSLTIESLEDQIRANHYRLQQIARQYHITVEEVEEWIRLEGRRLMRPVQLTEWQSNEYQRLLQQIQQNHLTLEELKQQLRADRGRLQQLANRYHVTIEEIEEWIINEGYKLVNSAKPAPNNNMGAWQQHEREYLLALVQANHVTLKNFEEHLAKDQMRMENVANHFGVTVDQIIEFLRGEYKRLAQLKLISEGEETVVQEVVQEWQGSEKQHIQQILQEHAWTIEELERKLTNDRQRLQQLANQYHITITEIEEWYRTELQKLLQNKSIQSENLTDWQKREKERLYRTIVDQHLTIEELQRQLMGDRNALRRLATQYRITIEQLISWHRKELGRMANLGLGKPLESANLNSWQEAERKRLRAIPVEIIITMEELLEFIESDGLFQNNLTAKYEVSTEDLWKFQRQELQLMKNEGLLETLRLNHLEGWQRRERDRLYNLIRTQNFAFRNLAAWQTDSKMAMIASMYRLSVNTIKDWQMQEMQRIEKIARHYKMSLNALEDFRFNELERLKAISHKDFLTEHAFISWEDREKNRLNTLVTRTGLSGARLDKWRRKLYLLAQGLIDLDFNEGGYGGIELNTNTSASGRRNETISSDRGDQPPQVYQEEFDDSEPQLGNPSDQNAPMIQIPLPQPPPATYIPSHPGPPHGYDHGHHQRPPYANYPTMGGHGDSVYSVRTHRKKEYTITAPADVPVVLSNDDNQGRYSLGRGSVYGNMNVAPVNVPDVQNNDDYQGRYSLGRGPAYGNMNAGAMKHDVEEDLGQQHQVEDWNSYSDDADQKSEKFEDIGQHQEDLGQQQQVELGHFTEADFGQQQVQHENYQHSSQQQVNSHSQASMNQASHHSSTSGAQATETTVVAAEPVTKKPFSWKAPTTWFG